MPLVQLRCQTQITISLSIHTHLDKNINGILLHTCMIHDRSAAGRARLKRDGTRAETRFGLSEKWTSQFKPAGESVQSTTGSRGVRISGQTMDRPCSEAQ